MNQRTSKLLSKLAVIKSFIDRKNSRKSPNYKRIFKKEWNSLPKPGRHLSRALIMKEIVNLTKSLAQ